MPASLQSLRSTRPARSSARGQMPVDPGAQATPLPQPQPQPTPGRPNPVNSAGYQSTLQTPPNFQYPGVSQPPAFNPQNAPGGDPVYYGQQIGANDPSMSYIPDLTSNDPNRIYRNAQNVTYNLGAGINSDLYGQSRDQQALYGQYGNLANQAYGQLAQTPGYTADEAGNIVREDGYRSAMTTPEQYASLGPNGQESAGMTGNTGSYMDYFNPQTFNDINQANENMQYANLERTGAAQDNAIGGLQSSYGQAIDPNRLRASGDYTRQAGMSDDEVTQLQGAAARNIGNQYQGQRDAVTRNAMASGNASPLGVAAAQNRLLQQQGVATTDALTDATIQARNAQRQAATGVEQTRLGAEQNLTGARMNAAGNVASSQLGAAQYQGGLTQAAQNQITGNQLGSQQYLTNTGTGIRQAQDTANAQRASQLYNIRQGNTMYGQQSTYQQGMGVNSALSQGYGNVANQRMAGQQKYRDYLTGQQGQALGASQTSQGQRIQNYNAMTGGLNANASQWGNYQIGKSSVPSGWQQVVGGIAGAASAYGKP